jgi:hypothetical protein
MLQGDSDNAEEDSGERNDTRQHVDQRCVNEGDTGGSEADRQGGDCKAKSEPVARRRCAWSAVRRLPIRRRRWLRRVGLLKRSLPVARGLRLSELSGIAIGRLRLRR